VDRESSWSWTAMYGCNNQRVCRYSRPLSRLQSLKQGAGEHGEKVPSLPIRRSPACWRMTPALYGWVSYLHAVVYEVRRHDGWSFVLIVNQGGIHLFGFGRDHPFALRIHTIHTGINSLSCCTCPYRVAIRRAILICMFFLPFLSQHRKGRCAMEG